MATVKFKAAVVIKRCSLTFMDGELPGVIATQEVEFELPEKARAWQLAAGLNDMKEGLLRDAVEVTLEQIE